MAFSDITIAEMVQKIRSGESSCIDTVQKSILNIEKGDTDVHSFISVQTQRTLDRAKTLDALPQEQKQAPSWASL